MICHSKVNLNSIPHAAHSLIRRQPDKSPHPPTPEYWEDRNYDELPASCVVDQLFVGGQMAAWSACTGVLVNATRNVHVRSSLPLHVWDVSLESNWTWQNLTACLQFVSHALANRHNVLIHCRVGRHRSAALAAVLLVFLHGHSADRAIETVHNRREGSWIKRDLKRFVCWAESQKHLHVWGGC